MRVHWICNHALTFRSIGLIHVFAHVAVAVFSPILGGFCSCGSEPIESMKQLRMYRLHQDLCVRRKALLSLTRPFAGRCKTLCRSYVTSSLLPPVNPSFGSSLSAFCTTYTHKPLAVWKVQGTMLTVSNSPTFALVCTSESLQKVDSHKKPAKKPRTWTFFAQKASANFSIKLNTLEPDWRHIFPMLVLDGICPTGSRLGNLPKTVALQPNALHKVVSRCLTGTVLSPSYCIS